MDIIGESLWISRRLYVPCPNRWSDAFKLESMTYNDLRNNGCIQQAWKHFIQLIHSEVSGNTLFI
jgi:hypothetical protein